MQRFGRYEVIEELGAGSMGAVYKARDPMMARDVAIKTIVPHIIGGPQADEFRERFFREARAAGRLAHPGIVTIHDVSEQDGIPFLVMEYVQGRTLQSVLESERLPIDRVLEIGIQLSDALDYAHRNGVIHRDIKPANILVTVDGNIKIADFGIAKLNDSQATSTGQVLGTPAYMAPEHFTGEQIDGRADIFAAGIVMYWMATGDKPFGGESVMAVQYKVLHTDPVPPRKLNPAISADLEASIAKALAKDRTARYQSGAELARDLRELRAGRSISMAGVAVPAVDKTVEMTTVLNSGTARTRAADRARERRERRRSRSSRPPRGAMFAMVLTVILVVGVVNLINRYFSREDTRSGTFQPPNESAQQASPATSATNTPAPKANESKAAPGRAETSAAKSDSIVLELTANQQTGVVFSTEGQPTQTFAMKPGDSMTLRAQHQASLVVSNRSALQWKLNGKTISFGDDTRGGQFLITPETIEDRVPFPQPPVPPDLDPGRGAVGRGNVLSSVARQQELARSPASTTLVINCPALPELVTLMVRMDGMLLFRREAVIVPGIGGGLSQLQTEAPAAPIMVERFMPSGMHTLQVSMLLGATRLGQIQEVTGQFDPGQHRTLSIRFGRENPRGERGRANRFSITLD
jgi:serine/threonine protein kinase